MHIVAVFLDPSANHILIALRTNTAGIVSATLLTHSTNLPISFIHTL
jgi:hypothetical protein